MLLGAVPSSGRPEWCVSFGSLGALVVCLGPGAPLPSEWCVPASWPVRVVCPRRRCPLCCWRPQWCVPAGFAGFMLSPARPSAVSPQAGLSGVSPPVAPPAGRSGVSPPRVPASWPVRVVCPRRRCPLCCRRPQWCVPAGSAGFMLPPARPSAVSPQAGLSGVSPPVTPPAGRSGVSPPVAKWCVPAVDAPFAAAALSGVSPLVSRWFRWFHAVAGASEVVCPRRFGSAGSRRFSRRQVGVVCPRRFA
jgi:hypothetical protein